YQPIIVGLLNGTLTGPVFVKICINTFLPVDNWRHLIPIKVGNPLALLLNNFQCLGRKHRFNVWKNLLIDLCLLILKRSTRLSFYTPGPFTFGQIANKATLKNIETNKFVINLNHN